MIELPEPLARARVTRREAEVLGAVAQRLPNKEIAEQLSLSTRTVESHVSALLRKLGVPDRRSLIEFGRWVQAMARRPRVPVPHVELVGRDADLAAGVARLDDPYLRLLSITGPPGVGKTLLSLHLAHRVQARYPHGAVLVPLATVRDPSQVLPSIAAALGIDGRSTRPVLDRLAEHLAERRMLLLLDNVEQLVAAAGSLAELIGRASGLTAVATSRVRLRVRMEQELELAPLPAPDPAHDGDVEVLRRNDGVRLFVARSRQATGAFTLTADNAAAVAETVRRLDGLPLALELAAARVPVLGAHGVRDRLHRRLQLLTHGPRDLPEHQQSLGRAVATSYGLLSADAQRLFRVLSVFAGDARLSAVEQLWAALPGAGDVALAELLAELREAHLITIRPGPHEPRVGMLETLREFAATTLGELGEAAVARAAHAATFRSLARQVEAALDLAVDQEHWLERLDADYDDVVGALGWAAQADPDCAAELGAALAVYWIGSGRLDEAKCHLRRLLTRPGPNDLVRGRITWAAGWICGLQGQPVEAALHFERALAIGQAMDDPRLTVRSLVGLGRLDLHRGRYEAARAAFERGLALAGAGSDVWALPLLLWHQGMALIAAGTLDDAEKLFAECVTHGQASGDTLHWVMGLYHLGGLALWRGDLATARALLAEVAVVQPGRWSVHGADHAPEMYGRVLVACGETDLGEELIHSALAGYRDAGNVPCIAHALEASARVAAAHGTMPQAVRLLAASTGLYTAHGLAPLPLEGLLHDQTVAAARASLSDAEFDAAWRAAGGLGVAAALAEAYRSG